MFGLCLALGVVSKMRGFFGTLTCDQRCFTGGADTAAVRAPRDIVDIYDLAIRDAKREGY